MSLDAQAASQPNRVSYLARCEQRIGYKFTDKAVLRAALTHASGAEHRLASNERLEFLGDAILGAVVCELLYHQYPDYLEGDLTKIKSIVVSRQTCAKISETLGMQEFLILGKGMTTHPDVPPSLLADVFESLVAAIYLDGGDAAAREFIEKYIGPEVELAAGGERSPLSSAALATKRPGDETKRKLSSGPPETRSAKSTARPHPSPPIELGRCLLGPGYGRSPRYARGYAAVTAANPYLPDDQHGLFIHGTIVVSVLACHGCVSCVQKHLVGRTSKSVAHEFNINARSLP